MTIIADGRQALPTEAHRSEKVGYKHTKLGWIPEEWDVSRVGDVLQVVNSLRAPLNSEERAGMIGSYSYYGPTGVLGYINEYRIDGTYCLIGEDGDHFLDYATKPQTLLVSGKFNVNNHAHLVQGTDVCDTEWFFRFFHHRNILPHITRQGAARYKLNKAALEDLLIAYPQSLTEQRRITTVLGAWDHAIAAVQQLLATQQERKRGLMQELLTGKRRFKGFGGKWKEVRLSSVVSKAKGSVVSSNEDHTGTPVIDAGSYEGGATLYSTDTDALRCIETDVLLLWDGSKAGRAMTGKRGIVGSTFALLKPKAEIDSGFLTARLTLDEYKIMAIREGSGIPHVPKDFLHWYKCALPPLDEQRAIVGLLNSLDKEAASLKEQLDHLTTQKRGLMQQLLTGAVRVKV